MYIGGGSTPPAPGHSESGNGERRGCRRGLEGCDGVWKGLAEGLESAETVVMAKGGIFEGLGLLIASEGGAIRGVREGGRVFEGDDEVSTGNPSASRRVSSLATKASAADAE